MIDWRCHINLSLSGFVVTIHQTYGLSSVCLLRWLLVLVSPCCLGQSTETLPLEDTSVIALKEVLISTRRVAPEMQRVAQSFVHSNTDLAASLDQLPGFRQVQASNYPLSYRGQHGSRLRIEQNGFRNTGVLQQGYYGEDINPGDIGEVRVVHGIKKAIYGSGSIGGVLLLENGKERVSSIYSGYETGNQERIVGLKLAPSFKGLGLQLSGKTTRATDYQLPNREKLLHSGYRQHSLSLQGSYALAGTQFSFLQQANNGYWKRPQGFQNNPFELRTFRNRYSYLSQLGAETTVSKTLRFTQKVSLHLQETDQQRRNFNADYTTLNNESIRSYHKNSWAYRGNLRWTKLRRVSIDAGIDVLGNKVREFLTAYDFLNDLFVDEQFNAARNEWQAGGFLFIASQWEHLTLKTAIRADFASIGNESSSENYQSLTGGIEAESVTKNGLTHSLSFGRYFRYPTHLEATGVFFGGRGIFFGNPEIDPEYNYQLEWRIRKQALRLSYHVETWFAWFTNRIVEFPINGTEFTYENLGHARTMGLSTSIVYRYPFLVKPHTLEVTFSSTFMKGDEMPNANLFGSGTPLLGIPSGQCRASITYTRRVTKKFLFHALAGLDYTFPFQRIPDGFINQVWGILETPAYLLTHAKVELRYDLKRSFITLKMEGSNLTNTAYMPFGSRITEMGRSMQFFIAFGF
ncbi:MAG: TonB-dependent receptor plug domain-containing protein [Bacteroidota bacterium]